MKKILILVASVLLVIPVAWAQDESPPVDSLIVDSTVTVGSTVNVPAPVSMLEAADDANDHGHATVLTWELSPDDNSDSTGYANVLSYEIFRWVPYLNDTLADLRSQFNVAQSDLVQATSSTGPIKERIRSLRTEIYAAIDRLPEVHANYPEGGAWVRVGMVPSGSTEFENTGSKDRFNGEFIPDNTDLYYRVDAVTIDPDVRTESEIAGPVQCYGQWYNSYRTIILVTVIFFTLATVFFVRRARGGSKLYVRPIGGIEAVDDAIGRATEMGRPILYVMGLGTAADVATIASFTILGRVAKRVAEYQTELIVPTYDPIVMSVAQEVVKSAFLDAGRPDAYKEDTVHFVTQSQFAYVAAVNGTMLRELPATNIYMGKFFAESLLFQ